MYEFTVRIGDHYMLVSTESERVKQWFANDYAIEDSAAEAHLAVHVEDGYGVAFVDHQYSVRHENQYIIFERKDYRLLLSSDFTAAILAIYDDFTLRHAMMNLYSAFIVHLEWGLLLHASCVIEDDRAWLFSGRSGAGKSTVASLSAPRRLLSDEASIVRVTAGTVDVFDSPFRSETTSEHTRQPIPLDGIHLLVQSQRIHRQPLKSGDAVARLMDKAFYWSYSTNESRKILRLCARLLQHVPVYELEFQKNNRFWEVITCPQNIAGAMPRNPQN